MNLTAGKQPQPAGAHSTLSPIKYDQNLIALDSVRPGASDGVASKDDTSN